MNNSRTLACRYNCCMSWASRRRFEYTAGVIIFFAVVIGGPVAYHFLTIPASCSDGVQNQGETSVDRGGPCPLLDPNYLQPTATLWTRSFRVRDGSYNAVAYIQNPNPSAGALDVPYHFGLYDANNILIAERTGTISIMPGGITPVFVGNIDTGSRIVVHTYFDLTSPPVWRKVRGTADAVSVSAVQPSDFDTTPRVTANAKNTSVNDIRDIAFVAVIFDPSGNAFAASQTALDVIQGGEQRTIYFSWPSAIPQTLGRIDILPVVKPIALP